MTVVFAAANGLKISARRVVCAAVGDEGALRMRRTPCGCAPYDRLSKLLYIFTIHYSLFTIHYSLFTIY